ncbi:uncharacterized [Tachysurus ichikawai]
MTKFTNNTTEEEEKQKSVMVFDPFRSPYRNFSRMTSPARRAAWKPVVSNGALISTRDLSPFTQSPFSDMCGENTACVRNST